MSHAVANDRSHKTSNKAAVSTACARPGAKASRIGLILVASSMALLMAFIAIGASETVPLVIGVTATLGVAITRRILATRRLQRLDTLDLVLCYYALAYSVGTVVFWLSPPDDPRFHVTSSELWRVLLLALAAQGGIIAGYSIGHRALSRVPTDGAKVHHLSLVRLAAVAAVGWLARAEQIRTGRYFHTVATGQLESSASNWTLFALAQLPFLVTLALIFRWDVFGARASRFHRSICALLVAVDILFYLPSATRASVVAPVVTLVVLYLRRNPKVTPTWRLIPLALLLLPVFPIISEYRGDNIEYQESGTGRLVEVTTDQLGDPPALFTEAIRTTAERFSDGLIVARYFRADDEVWPYSSLETLSWALLAPVPRAIFPSKADPGLLGNSFGRAIGVVNPTDLTTSVTIGHPLEISVSLGIWGAPLGFLALGFVYWIWEYWSRPGVESRRSSIRSVAAAACMWTLLTSPATIIAHGLMGAIKLAAFNVIVLKLAALSVGNSRRAL